MEKDGTLKILNYYLEYEIYNLANSTQIKTDMNNCYIIKEKIDAGKVLKELNRLKQNKIRIAEATVINVFTCFICFAGKSFFLLLRLRTLLRWLILL